MKIIVNNNGASSIIDTAEAGINEVMGMIVGALMQEGFPFSVIVTGLSEQLDEFKHTT